IAIEAYIQIDLRRTRESELRDNALRQARLAAGEFDRIMEGTRQLLVALTAVPTVRDHAAAECNAVFPALLRQFPQYASLAVLEPDGSVWCSGRDGVTVGRAASDRSYFQRALATKSFAIGEYAIGRVSKVPVLQFAYPVVDATGAVSGIVLAT